MTDDLIDSIDDPKLQGYLRSMRLAEYFDSAVATRTIAIDMGGHNRRADDFGYRKFGDLHLKWTASPDDVEALTEALKGGPPLEKPLRTEPSCLFKCGVCGEEFVLETDGHTLRTVSQCPYPDGPIFDFELNVPSGRMVVANDLRPLFDFVGDYDINTCVGCMKHPLAMAENGCAQGFVGNSCPGVFRLDKNRLTIAVTGSGEEDDDGNIDEDDPRLTPPGEHVAGICTDLWWYSIVDHDEFVRRAGEETLDDHNAETVDVKPGVYRFRHLFHSIERDSPHQQTYTEIEWVREPDPVRDFKAERLAFHLTAGQVVAESLSKYPSLHHGPDAIRSVADHIFCTIGGGGDWHENGFVSYNPDIRPDAPEVDIADFSGRYPWYPLSEKYSALCIAAGLYGSPLYLNKSFRALAFNVAMCIVDHGVELGRFGATKEDEDAEKVQARKTEQLAERCLRGLAKLYPDDVPEFCVIEKPRARKRYRCRTVKVEKKRLDEIRGILDGTVAPPADCPDIAVFTADFGAVHYDPDAPAEQGEFKIVVAIRPGREGYRISAELLKDGYDIHSVGKGTEVRIDEALLLVYAVPPQLTGQYTFDFGDFRFVATLKEEA